MVSVEEAEAAAAATTLLEHAGCEKVVVTQPHIRRSSTTSSWSATESCLKKKASQYTCTNITSIIGCEITIAQWRFTASSNSIGFTVDATVLAHEEASHGGGRHGFHSAPQTYRLLRSVCAHGMASFPSGSLLSCCSSNCRPLEVGETHRGRADAGCRHRTRDGAGVQQ